MSYAQVKAQVRQIIEQTTPTDGTAQSGGCFVYYPEGLRERPDDRPPDRAFWLQAGPRRVRGPLTTSPVRIVLALHICVAYTLQRDADALDSLIASDYEALVSSLLDATRWQRQSSTIEKLWPDPEGLLSADIIPTNQSTTLLVLSVDVEHKL